MQERPGQAQLAGGLPRQRGGSAGKPGGSNPLNPSSPPNDNPTPMTSLRLRPLIRLSGGAISNSGVFRGYSEFSTIALHQLQHPAPASTSSRFLPRFLDPSIYWKGSKSVSKAKVPQGPKPWNPATFYIAIFLLIGSQAIQMISLRHEHDDYMRRANVKIAVLKEVIERLQKGEDVDVEGMLGVGDEKEEKSWEDVLREIEEEDAIWQAKARKKQKQPFENPVSKSSGAVKAEHSNAKNDAEQPTARTIRQPRSARDYGA